MGFTGSAVFSQSTIVENLATDKGGVMAIGNVSFFSISDHFAFQPYGKSFSRSTLTLFAASENFGIRNRTKHSVTIKDLKIYVPN